MLPMNGLDLGPGGSGAAFFLRSNITFVMYIVSTTRSRVRGVNASMVQNYLCKAT